MGTASVWVLPSICTAHHLQTFGLQFELKCDLLLHARVMAQRRAPVTVAAVGRGHHQCTMLAHSHFWPA